MNIKFLSTLALASMMLACKGPDKAQEQNVDIVPIETSTTISAQQPKLEDTEWKLVEVIGKPIDEFGEQNKVPSFTFHSADKRMSGNAGCNNMGASYELLEGSKIQISQAFSTKMACPNMELEDQVGQMLSNLDTYIINENGELILTKARMAPMLKFVAVEK